MSLNYYLSTTILESFPQLQWIATFWEYGNMIDHDDNQQKQQQKQWQMAGAGTASALPATTTEF
jgi:hypothetical protein